MRVQCILSFKDEIIAHAYGGEHFLFCFYFILFLNFLVETEGRQAGAKAQGAVYHLASFPSGREDISQPGIEPPTSSSRFVGEHYN
jgi:hypothetical protein